MPLRHIPSDIRYVLFGYVFALVFSTVLIITFLAAFLSGDMQIMVYINMFDEAYVELLLLIIAFPVVLRGFIGCVRLIDKEVAA
jgi:hypothetical protein